MDLNFGFIAFLVVFGLSVFVNVLAFILEKVYKKKMDKMKIEK